VRAFRAVFAWVGWLVPYVQARDIEMCYEMAGDGDPVLLISGTGGDLRNAPLGDNPLVREFSVVAYDQRGLGQTAKPDVAYTMADYTDDAVALLDALGVERVHVVGISFGGMVAQHMAVRYGDRVGRLVLCCTSSGGRGQASADLVALSQLPDDERDARFLSLLDTRCRPGEPVPEELVPILEARKHHIQASEPEALMGARRQLEARADHDVYDALASIASPTLVIGGRTDGIAPVANMDAIAAQIPDSERLVCHGGHLFLAQDPRAWPQIITFLSGAT